MATITPAAPPPTRRRSIQTAGSWGLRGTALLYLLALLVIPLISVVQDGLRAGLVALWQTVTLPIARHALLLTLWTAVVTVIINAVMGTLTAYVLVRYQFPGKTLLNAIIDLPLALPTLITGVMFVLLFGPQTATGGWLSRRGIEVIFAPPGIVLVLLFITLPLVVRAIQPVLEGLDGEPEAAAATLGANGWTIFRRITLPAIALPLTSSMLLSFARCAGEFGAVVLVAGNIPFHMQTAAVYVLEEIESFDQQGASAISLVLLAIAFALILVVDLLQQRAPTRGGTR